ncbi:Fic family protein [Labrenzia sp. R4_2]|uniref:Fic family protein n=1 Tax=Labrenzia sp. R4_2 TaxID=2821107 RepID=UPI001ADA277E|nr:Fic family protein [Labrenzia sp. R4_2]MBO9422776.1 Fic family protein [Labrenzia sp. R4_2]
MANKVPEDALKELQEIVAEHPDGISAPDIAKSLSEAIPRRTLQYRLKQLVEVGLLRMTGSGRWAKYHLAISGQPAAGEPAQQENDYGRLIRLSDEGQAVRAYVTQPIGARKPVGYNVNFLEQYEPNSTFYLRVEDRERLREIGKPRTVSQPAGTYAKLILNRLLIDLAWNSSRLEGNTYSLLDTRRLIEFGEEATGRNHIEAQMILNHKDAIEFLVGTADEIDFNRYTLLNLHALLSNNLLPDPSASGRLRFVPVGIDQSVFHPLEVPQLIEEAFNQLLQKVAAIEDPFEQAFFVMVQLPYLQPFDDVNKRVSRLAANIPLIRNNLAPLSFTDVSQRAYTDAILGFYELNDVSLLRDVFFWAYERSAAKYAAVRQSLGEPDPFRLKYRAELREIIAMLIRAKVGRKQIGTKVSAWASSRVESEDRARFTEIVEDELIGMHEGNFARYQVRPSEFKTWQEVWGPK